MHDPSWMIDSENNKSNTISDVFTHLITRIF